MHTFNDALVECLKKKLKFHELGPQMQDGNTIILLSFINVS